jgi:hypothetical protein
MTLAWRNQDHIRTWFFHSDVITPEQHRRWFDAYRGRDDDFVFVIEETEELRRPVGQVALYYIDWEPGTAEYGRLMIGDTDAPEIVQRIEAVAMDAYRALQCRDYARVDMRLDTNTGEVFVLEVNPNPDLADSCAFAASARASGRTYDQLICEIANLAVARMGQQVPAHTGFDLLLREYQAKKKQKT